MKPIGPWVVALVHELTHEEQAWLLEQDFGKAWFVYFENVDHNRNLQGVVYARPEPKKWWQR